MWCDNCHAEVNTSQSPVSGLEQCTECGSEMESATSLGNQSIAQTAHALLKRWEETRFEPESVASHEEEQVSEPVAQQSSSRPAKVYQDETSEVEEERLQSPPPILPGPSAPPVQSVVKKQAPQPTQQPLERPRTANPFSFPKRTARLDTKTMPKSQPPKTVTNTTLLNTTAINTAEKPQAERRSFGKTEPKEKFEPTIPARKSASNDASTLMEKARQPEVTPRQLNVNSQKQPTLEQTISRPQLEPRMTQNPAISAADISAPRQQTSNTEAQTEAREGQVRFTPRKSETFADFEPQQDYTPTKRARNWSAIIGQALVFCSSLGMTGGIGIIIAARFGAGIDIAESTGWLAFAGSHLIFVLGIYTNLSSRMEQVLNEMHSRSDELAQILTYQQTLSQNRTSPRENSSQPRKTEFARGSLAEELASTLPR